MYVKYPFADKNSERKMLLARCEQIKEYLGSKILVDGVDTGDFMFCNGQSGIESFNEGDWVKFGADDHWGYKEQYCRFKQQVTVPEAFSGKKVAYEITPFPDGGWHGAAQQFIVYVNGKITQGIDHNHTFIFLTQCANGGERFDISLAAYCDDWNFNGPTKLRAYLKVYDEDVNTLWYDLDTLCRTAYMLSPDDIARVDIITALNDACNLLELETPDKDVFKSSVKAASEYLHKNIFGAKNAALVSAIGHTHIDTAWLWRLRQTREKAGRSFATVINLMKEYPEYKFMSPQAQLYDFVKQDYPDLYNSIKDAVKQGRWEPEGSMWVESDTNVISGESLVRQFLFGKHFFKNEFGVETKIMWLPDVFGYSAALPQIMKLAGINYFMTTKISWNEYTRFPYDTFLWEGIDGTSVLAHFIPMTDNDDTKNFSTTYNANITPTCAIHGWQRYSNKDLNKNVLCSYGYGDGGGGPSRAMLENIRRMDEGIPGCPNVRQEFAGEFFKRLETEVAGSRRLPMWRGELYLEYHRGTLTAQARNKKYNRKSEFMYHDVEALCETAHILCGEAYPSYDINEAWKIILLNQFHDIIPGSSIAPVYEDSKAQYEKILGDGNSIRAAAIGRIASAVCTDSRSAVVFNTFGLKRSDVVLADVECPDNTVVLDSTGREMPSQRTFDGKLIFLAENVPANGYKTYRLANGKCSCPAVCGDTSGVENEFYSLRFDEDMNISSLYFKECERELAEGKTVGRLTAYEDRSHDYEAWDIKCYYDEKSWDINDVQSAEVIECGPVRTVVEICRRFNSSVIKQYYVFYAHTQRIDVMYDIDWKERNVALKADYPVDVNTDRATFDIQFGNIQRTATSNTLADFAQFESCGHKWADLSDNGFGLSVLNDCKYGWAVKDGHIRPTLLRSATTPNKDQDRERHCFTYAIYPHSGTVASSDVVREAYSINIPLVVAVTESHNGTLAPEFSLVASSADNIIIETVKKAEESDELIVRMYETWNKKTKTEIAFGAPVSGVRICDLLENDGTELTVNDNSVVLEFKPFEIKTLKVKVTL